MILYHVTEASRVPSIRAHGLVLGSEPHSDLFGRIASDPTAIWFFELRRDAVEFIDSETGWALLHFDVPETAAIKWVDYREGERWYYVLTSIVPARLRKVEML